MSNSHIFTSSISSKLMQHVLFKGFALGFLGALILLIAGSSFSPSLLQEWGWVFFLIAIGLITLGLLPYRRLSRQQLNPDKLILIDEKHIDYYRGGERILTLPVNSIAALNEISFLGSYGVAVKLVAPPIEPIIVHADPERVERMRREGVKYGNADLYFPYFTRQTCRELKELLKELEELSGVVA